MRRTAAEHGLNGASIHVADHGAGTPIVLLHAGLSSHVDWAPVVPHLADAHRVVTPDSRGHGRSTNPAGTLSYAALADDVAALIALLGLERPVVGGWSDGGQVTLELAARHPGIAAALVVGAAYPEFHRSGLRETHRALLGADAAGTPDLALLDAELEDVAPELKARHAGGDEHWRALVTQTAGMWLDYPGLAPEAVGAIDVPVLVLAGDRDELIPFDLSLALHRALPRGELAVVPGLGHDGPSPQRAPLFAALIRDLARRHADPDPPPSRREPTMLADTKAYSGFAVTDMTQARRFYAETLGLRTSEEHGLMWLHLAGGRDTLVYEQPDATPASSTILNFEVDDVDEAVGLLRSRGVRFERVDGLDQDDTGVFRGEGPYIAWFKDPAGNVLSVLQEG